MADTPPTQTRPAAPTKPSRNPIVWFVRDPQFRFYVLTGTNTINVFISGFVAIYLNSLTPVSGTGYDSTGWTLFILFPVVPATLSMPVVSLVIVAIAAGFSLIPAALAEANQRGRAWLRSFTIWGAWVLGTPLAIMGLFYLLSLLSTAVGRS